MRPTVERILAQVVGDAVGSPPAVEPQGDDAPLSAPCQPPWTVVGTAGAVLHGLAGPVPAHPPADGGRRDLEALGHPAHRPAFFHHQMSKTTAPLRGQRCVSVGHEGLRSAMRVCQPTSCRRPSHNLPPVHNLPRKCNQHFITIQIISRYAKTQVHRQYHPKRKKPHILPILSSCACKQVPFTE